MMRYLLLKQKQKRVRKVCLLTRKLARKDQFYESKSCKGFAYVLLPKFAVLGDFCFVRFHKNCVYQCMLSLTGLTTGSGISS